MAQQSHRDDQEGKGAHRNIDDYRLIGFYCRIFLQTALSACENVEGSASQAMLRPLYLSLL